MRDPRIVDPEVEAAIEHAVKLLRPFVSKGAFRRRDPPLVNIPNALQSIDDGRRRTCAQWERYLGQFPEPKIPHPRGHPAFLFRRAIILLVLDDIVARGFFRTRHPKNYDKSDKRQSACAIVSAALCRLDAGMTEAAVSDLVRPPRPKSYAQG
jgi:hypothetical protein